MKAQSDMMARLVDRAGEDDAFRAQLLSDPKAAIENELGVTVPEGFRIKVLEDGDDVGHLVLPPAGRLSDSELSQAAGGGMWRDIGQSIRNDWDST